MRDAEALVHAVWYFFYDAVNAGGSNDHYCEYCRFSGATALSDIFYGVDNDSCGGRNRATALFGIFYGADNAHAISPPGNVCAGGAGGCGDLYFKS